MIEKIISKFKSNKGMEVLQVTLLLFLGVIFILLFSPYIKLFLVEMFRHMELFSTIHKH